MSKKPNKAFVKQRRRVIFIAISIIFALALAYDLSGVGGNIRFYSKWVECGQKPVKNGLIWKNVTPHYLNSPTFSTMRLSPHYFCTPLEAERAGYSASPDTRYFPELEAIGEQPPNRAESIESLKSNQ